MQFHGLKFGVREIQWVKLGPTYFPMLPARFRLASIAFILILAAVLRFWNLSGLPTGLHGDEGVVGYEARRILQTGSIGPYSPDALGQPTGPIYLVAPVLLVLGNEIITVRLVPALLGTLSVLALFGLIRRFSDEKTALAGAFILAALAWHIHYARIGFPLESWPLVCIFVAWTTLGALEKSDWRWWALAGWVNGCGFYVYNAHPLFFGAAASFALVWEAKSTAAWTKKIAFGAAYVVAALVAANFLIRYALDPLNNYGSHFSMYSTWNQSSWQALPDFGARASFLIARYFSFWGNILVGLTPDYVDGAGLAPLIAPPVFALAVVGMLSFSRRDALTQFSRWIVLVMPLAAVVTIEAFARRPFALAPFLCVLSAVGAAQIVRWGRAKNPLAAKAATWGVAALLVWTPFATFRAYFGTFAHDSRQNWVFCDELTRSIEYMKTLPPERPIYFYSSRWSILYETRRFLAPDLNALNRSREFGAQNSGLTPLAGQSRPVWVLLDSYKTEIDALKARFPGGKEVQGPFSASANGAAFVAYEAPQ